MFEETKNAILKKIEKSKKLVIDMIEKSNTLEDWEQIKEEIDFIGLAYGALVMIEHTEKISENVENKFSSPQSEGMDQT